MNSGSSLVINYSLRKFLLSTMLKQNKRQDNYDRITVSKFLPSYLQILLQLRGETGQQISFSGLICILP